MSKVLGSNSTQQYLLHLQQQYLLHLQHHVMQLGEYDHGVQEGCLATLNSV
jgi:hypothetical protein